jgi:hypothetical protein
MRFPVSCAITLVLLLGASPARTQAPENWVYSKATDGVIGFETLKVLRDEAAGTVNGYNFVYAPGTNTMNGVVYSFSLSELDYNCAANAYRVVFTDVYDADGTKLQQFTPVDATTWVVITPGTIWSIGKAIFCDNAVLEAARTAASLGDAFVGAIELAATP